MNKITLFNKLKKTALSAFALGLITPAAWAQTCPGNITVNGSTTSCGAVVTFANPTGPPPITANLVTNPNGDAGSTAGWTLVNGGQGWIAKEEGFITSYVQCSKSQVITLADKGLTAAYMDTSPSITISDDYRTYGGTNDTFFLNIELRGATGNVLASYASGTLTTGTATQTVTKIFTGYPAGVRSIYIQDGGKDGEGWAGQYGAYIRNTTAKVALANTSTVSQSKGLASGATFPVGTTTNSFTVTTNGVPTTCTFDVVVKDVTLPTVLTKPLAVKLSATGTFTLLPADINNGSTDSCGIATMVLDKSSFDCTNLGTNTVTLTVTDTNGNKATNTAVVTITDDILPVAKTKSATIQLNPQGTVTLAPADVDNLSTDNCVLTYTLDKTSFTCENLGDNTVTLTVTDLSGHTSTATAVVTITDAAAPVVLTKYAIVKLNTQGTGTLTAAEINNASTDNCTIASYTLSKTDFTCADLGENTVTLTVKDASGNIGTGTAIVLVADVAPPIATTKPFTVSLNAQRTATITPEDVNNNSTDNCGGIASYALNQTTFTCGDLGENLVNLTVIDKYGNKATTTAVVTVTDPNNYCTTAGVNVASLSAGIKLYPNPTNGSITITTSQNVNNVEVYDMSGRLVKNLNLKGTGNLTTDISALNAGVYFVKIYGDNSSAIKQIVKQ